MIRKQAIAWAVLVGCTVAQQAGAQQAGTQTAKPAGTVTEPPQAVPDTEAGTDPQNLALPTIEVTGALMGLATGPLDGFVATDSATAGKSAAPLVETPSSVSVVSAADLAARGGVPNVGAALAYTPGIWVDPSFNATTDSGFTIGGFSSWGANIGADDTMQCTAWGCVYTQQAPASASLTWRF